MMNRKWLKKYTELEHAESILTTCSLHLGEPTCWQDKNDSELIRSYGEAISTPRIRATCLTGAADRFHFWTVFGSQHTGICFWFNRKSLVADIEKDPGLVAQDVIYRKPRSLREIPYSKRAQYSDEKEFRVLTNSRTFPMPTSFSFSPNTLRRIYLNAWLSPEQVDVEKGRLNKMLVGNLNHVEVLQSRILRKQDWIQHARDIAKNVKSPSND